MKILAVSDIEDKILENIIATEPEKLKDVDCIIACGDLTGKYLEYVTDSVHKNMFFVSGNHFTHQIYGDKFKTRKMRKKLYKGKGMRHRFGGIDMHGRMEIFKDYMIVGFGGAKRYNPGNFQFEEFEMEKLIKRAISSVRWQKIKDFVTFKKKKEVIVISHAPVAGVHDKKDRCHQGFECFRTFISKIKPQLWLHGHIHIEEQKKIQHSTLEKTLIVNAYASKVIEAGKSEIIVKRVYD